MAGELVRAARSPSAVALAAAGAAGGLVAGFPALAVAGLAVAGLVVRVALAVPRRRAPRIDPFAVGEPWRRHVQDVLKSRARYRQLVASVRPGPLRERLEQIGGRVDDAVHECWEVARRGHLLERALRSLDPDALRASADRAPAEAAASLRAQLESADRVAAVAADARERLRVIDLRLGETVAGATELALQATDATRLGALGSDLDDLVAEVEALRLALEEVDGGTATSGEL